MDFRFAAGIGFEHDDPWPNVTAPYAGGGGTGSIGRMVRRVGSSGIAPLHGGSRAVSSSQGSHGCGLLHAAACSTLRVVYVNTARSDRERTAHSRSVADNGYASDPSALLDRLH